MAKTPVQVISGLAQAPKKAWNVGVTDRTTAKDILAGICKSLKVPLEDVGMFATAGNKESLLPDTTKLLPLYKGWKAKGSSAKLVVKLRSEAATPPAAATTTAAPPTPAAAPVSSAEVAQRAHAQLETVVKQLKSVEEKLAQFTAAKKQVDAKLAQAKKMGDRVTEAQMKPLLAKAKQVNEGLKKLKDQEAKLLANRATLLDSINAATEASASMATLPPFEPDSKAQGLLNFDGHVASNIQALSQRLPKDVGVGTSAFEMMCALVGPRSTPQLREQALRIILNSCTSESTQKYLFHTSILPLLVTLLDPASPENIVKLTSWLFSNLSADASNSKSIACVGAIPALVSLLESENDEVVTHCYECFRNMFQHDTLYVEVFRQTGGVLFLLDMIIHGENNRPQQALELLDLLGYQQEDISLAFESDVIPSLNKLLADRHVLPPAKLTCLNCLEGIARHFPEKAAPKYMECNIPQTIFALCSKEMFLQRVAGIISALSSDATLFENWVQIGGIAVVVKALRITESAVNALEIVSRIAQKPGHVLEFGSNEGVLALLDLIASKNKSHCLTAVKLLPHFPLSESDLHYVETHELDTAFVNDVFSNDNDDVLDASLVVLEQFVRAPRGTRVAIKAGVAAKLDAVVCNQEGDTLLLALGALKSFTRNELSHSHLLDVKALEHVGDLLRSPNQTIVSRAMEVLGNMSTLHAAQLRIATTEVLGNVLDTVKDTKLEDTRRLGLAVLLRLAQSEFTRSAVAKNSSLFSVIYSSFRQSQHPDTVSTCLGLLVEVSSDAHSHPLLYKSGIIVELLKGVSRMDFAGVVQSCAEILVRAITKHADRMYVRAQKGIEIALEALEQIPKKIKVGASQWLGVGLALVRLVTTLSYSAQNAQHIAKNTEALAILRVVRDTHEEQLKSASLAAFKELRFPTYITKGNGVDDPPCPESLKEVMKSARTACAKVIQSVEAERPLSREIHVEALAALPFDLKDRTAIACAIAATAEIFYNVCWTMTEAVMKELSKLNKKGEGVISGVDMQKIFSNVPSLLSFQGRYLQNVKNCVHEFDPDTSLLGEYVSLCIGMTDFEALMIKNLNGISLALNTLKECCETRALPDFMEQAKANNPRLVDLDVLILFPATYAIQNLSLWKALLEITPSTHPDFAGIKGAIRQFQRIVSIAQETGRHVVDPIQEKYWDLSNMIGLPHFSLLDGLCEVLPSKSVDVVMRASISIMTTSGVVVDFIEHAIRKEINATVQESTLFRGQSPATKCMSIFTQAIGDTYLQSSIRKLMQWIVEQDLPIELDPTRTGPEDNLDENLKNLRVVCQRVVDHVNGTISKVPIAIRKVCQILHEIVNAKFPNSALTSVGGLFFLRFVCPVFLAPQNLLGEDLITPDVKRRFILISKVIQNLSNNVAFGKKEPFMAPMNDFIEENRSKMIVMQKRLASVPASLSLREAAIEESQYRSVYELMSLNFAELEPQLETEMADIVSTNLPIIFGLEHLRLELGPVKKEAPKDTAVRVDSMLQTDDRKTAAKRLVKKESVARMSLSGPIRKKAASFLPLQDFLVNAGPAFLSLLQASIPSVEFTMMLPSVVRLYTALGEIDGVVRRELKADVDSASSPAELFSSQMSLGVLLAQHLSRALGFKYLRSTCVAFVREVVDCPLGIEIEPALLGPVSEETAVQNQKNLVYLVKSAFAVLERGVNYIPSGMLAIFSLIRQYVDEKFPGIGARVACTMLHCQILFPYILDPVRTKLFSVGFMNPEKQRKLSLVCNLIDIVIRHGEFEAEAMQKIAPLIQKDLKGRLAALEQRISSASSLRIAVQSGTPSDIDCNIIQYITSNHSKAVTKQLAIADQSADELSEVPFVDSLNAVLLELGTASRPLIELSNVMELELELSDRDSDGNMDMERLCNIYWLASRPDTAVIKAMGEVIVDYSFVAPLAKVLANMGVLEGICFSLIDEEVAATKHESTLFRTESVATKFVSASMHHFGDPYLQAIVRPLLLEVFGDGLEYEAPSTAPTARKEQSIQNLVMRCKRVFDALEGSASKIPLELRRLFLHMHNAVAKKFPTEGLCSVGGLFFLRFVCPCFVTPERWSIVKNGAVDNTQRRKIILISKVFQLLSNRLQFGKKEQYLVPLNDLFMIPNAERMEEFQRSLIRLDVDSPSTVPPCRMDPDSLAGFAELLLNRAQDVETELDKVLAEREVEYSLKSTFSPLVASEDGQKGTDYTPLVEMMTRTDFCFVEALYETTSNKDMDKLLQPVLRIMFSRNIIVGFIQSTLAQEIGRTIQESTLFRTNSLATYALSGFAQVVGSEYLKTVVKPILDDIANCPLDFEVNPSKLPMDADPSLAETNIKNLIRACHRAYDAVATSLDFCPITIRQACNFLFTLVGAKFPESAQKSVGGFFFLRFVCPCFVTPERFGLIAQATDYNADQRRKMILVSKVLQNMSNHLEFGAKEPFMHPLNESFMVHMIPKMKELQEKLAEVDENADFQLEQPLKDEDCIALHRMMVDHPNEIQEELTRLGDAKALNYPIRDLFNALLKKLGDPPPLEEETEEAQEEEAAGGQRRATMIGVRRRFMSVRAKKPPKVDLKKALNYKQLQWLLCQPSYSLPGALFEVTPNPKMKDLVDTLMSYYAAHGLLESMVSHELRAEIDRTVQESTLFRTDSLATFLIAGIARTRGAEYLERVIKPLIVSICNDGLNYEVNPAKLGPGDDVEQNTNNLVNACNSVFQKIVDTLDSDCPMILRRICYFLSTYVGEKFPESRQKSVGGYFFLRFACPPFVTPERFGLLDASEIDSSQRRKIILVSKVMQNLSNHLEFGKKEPFMEPINALFIRKKMDDMKALQDKLADVQPLPIPVIPGHAECVTECEDIWQRLSEAEADVITFLKEEQKKEEIDYDILGGYERVAADLRQQGEEA